MLVSQGSTRDLRRSTRKLKEAAFVSAKSMYSIVFMTCLPVLGAAVIGLTISWNFLPMPMYDGMAEALFVLTVLLQTSFAMTAVFIWDGN